MSRRVARDEICWRAYAGPLGTDPAGIDLGRPLRAGVAAGARATVSVTAPPAEVSAKQPAASGSWPFPSRHRPARRSCWRGGTGSRSRKEETALIEDAAHSLRLALEREEAGLAHQEAVALRRSRELQRDPVAAESRAAHAADRDQGICVEPHAARRDLGRGLAAAFLDRIAAESARLGRLVDDLLDFSAIESGIMRLQRDWCDIRLVVEAASHACRVAVAATVSVLVCDPRLPAVWADHDRLEQVLVNLLNNAYRHNPPGTRRPCDRGGPWPTRTPPTRRLARGTIPTHS